MDVRRFCPHCGKEQKSVGDFCPYCGKKIIRREVPPAPVPQKKSGSMVPLVIGLGVVIVLLAGFVIYGFLNPEFGKSLKEKASTTFDGKFNFFGKKDNRNEAAPSEIESTEPAEVETAEAAPSEKEEAKPVEEAASAEEQPWEKSYISFLGNSQYADDIFTLEDINKDGIPEIIIITDDGALITTSDSEGNLSSIETTNHVVAFDSSKGRICTSYNKDLGIQDISYVISDGKWSLDQHGETYISFNEYDDCVVSCDYRLNDKDVEHEEYITWLRELYGSVKTLEDLKYADCSKGAEALKDASLLNSGFYSKLNEKFTCDRTVKIVFASAEDDYYFDLKGGAGGADGNRALSGQDYDGNGALLSGKIHMNVGDRAYVIVGGAGGITQANRGVVAGGFNGGGDSFWSGGGGGSTDVYYNDVLVASAAGGGGGNYDDEGRPGRANYESSKNTLDSKLGGRTGYTKNDDAGGGGGAGWAGGAAGKNDHAGYGGLNGWDSAFFRDVNESTGASGTQSGTQDGYASVYRK